MSRARRKRLPRSKLRRFKDNDEIEARVNWRWYSRDLFETVRHSKSFDSVGSSQCSTTVHPMMVGERQKKVSQLFSTEWLNNPPARIALVGPELEEKVEPATQEIQGWHT